MVVRRGNVECGNSCNFVNFGKLSRGAPRPTRRAWNRTPTPTSTPSLPLPPHTHKHTHTHNPTTYDYVSTPTFNTVAVIPHGLPLQAEARVVLGRSRVLWTVSRGVFSDARRLE